MYSFRRRRPKYTYSDGEEKKKKHFPILPIILVSLVVIAICGLFLDELSTSIAVSDACDAVTYAVNASVSQVIHDENYPSDYFINYEKDSDGRIKAISSNMANINLLSTEILSSVIASTDDGVLHVSIPIGNLSGINVLMGKGPNITVDVIMLTSSKVDFRNEIESTGINQTKYQLYLDITMDIDVLVPWGTESAETVTEVLISDTVIVGDVPSTYLNTENCNGRSERNSGTSQGN